MQTTLYALCIGEHNQRQEGPYTAAECRARVEEAYPGIGWNWSATPDGAQVARDDETGRLLAEAIPQ